MGVRRNLIGEQPTTTILLGNRMVEVLLDTGSQVSTVTSRWLEENAHWTTIEECGSIRLKAANGLPIPYKGIAVLDIKIFGEKLQDVPFLVTTNEDRKDTPGLVGMNILSRCKSLLAPFDSIITKERRDADKVFTARVTCLQDIPPCSIATVKVTYPLHLKLSHLILASQTACPLLSGVLLMPTLGFNDFNFHVRLANLSEEHVILKARVPVANVELVDSVEGEEPLTINLNCNEMTIEQRPEPEENPLMKNEHPDEPILSGFNSTSEEKEQLFTLLREYNHIFAKKLR